MPMRITIEKFLASVGEYWTNVYWADFATPAAAIPTADDLVTAERSVTLPAVQFTKYRIDDGTPLTEVWETKTLNLPGLSATTGDPVPLFVVARVDFSVAGGGRPSRKYLRGVLTEAVMTMVAIDSGQLAALNSYASAVVAAATCDVDGQGISSGSANPMPGMRQLRRGSKKSSTP
jgi:hypothetical protein